MPKVRRKRIASRGSVNNIILEALNEGDKYGYEIIKQVEEKTNGEIKLKQPSLYSSLSRLEQKGYISSYWGGSDIGGRRHYYYITKAGRHYYNTAILKLEVQESDEDIEAMEKAAAIKRQQIMNECNTTKFIEDDDTVYGPKQDKPSIMSVEEDEIESNVQESIESNVPQVSEEIEMVIIHTDEDDIIEDEHSYPIETQENNNINEQIDNDRQLKHYQNLIRNSNHRFAMNSKVLKTHNPTLTYKKKQVMIKDVDGIYKLRDEEYNPFEYGHSSSRPRIIDNVIIRRNINVVDYEDAKAKSPTKQETNNIENLSQQEKDERNKKFASKFDEITNKIIQEREREKEESFEEDYRSKLDMLSNKYDDTQYDEEEEETYIPRNTDYYNVTLEEGEDPFSEDYMLDEEEDESEQLTDDKFIDFDEEPVESKKTTSHDDELPTIKGYKEFRASTTQQVNLNFIKVNKAKFLFGFAMVLLMILELTATFFIIKSTNNYYDKDMAVYVCGYAVIGIFALIFLTPYLFNQEKKALQTFKFKYSAIFGLLTFLILSILVYAFNSLAGFDASNLTYFASTIFVPLVLALNFAIYPFIYNFIIKIKSLY